MRKCVPNERNYNAIIKAVCRDRLYRLYGDEIPEEARSRFDDEMALICKNDYAVSYYLANKISQKCEEEGIPFIFRGTVGSSFVAFLLGVSEINPLSGENGGFDLPYEIFMAPDGSREPDFDFNVPIECQETLKEYLNDIFDDYHVSNAYYQYEEEVYLHPTKVLLIPNDPDTYSSSLNLNGNAINPEKYDFHDLLEYFIDIDICAHNEYSNIKRLKEATGVYPDLSVIEDLGVLELFKKGDLDNIPEFGNDFALSIMEETKADGFDDYVRVNLLCHGINVWKENGEDFIKSGNVTLHELISSRDDVFIYLMSKGIDINLAYDISEYVRKGRAVSDKWKRWDEYSGVMKAADIPDWYINSCKKTGYLFPRAHAAAYVVMAMRLAYYKVYYRSEFDSVMINR